jgi:hypothetical protein
VVTNSLLNGMGHLYQPVEALQDILHDQDCTVRTLGGEPTYVSKAVYSAHMRTWVHVVMARYK